MYFDGKQGIANLSEWWQIRMQPLIHDKISAPQMISGHCFRQFYNKRLTRKGFRLVVKASLPNERIYR